VYFPANAEQSVVKKISYADNVDDPGGSDTVLLGMCNMLLEINDPGAAPWPTFPITAEPRLWEIVMETVSVVTPPSQDASFSVTCTSQ
jgi:hypothetical protein